MKYLLKGKILGRMNLELSRIKIDLGRANKWTKYSMIVTHLGNNTGNIRTGIGYE